jgi:uncharacterized protein YhfF
MEEARTFRGMKVSGFGLAGTELRRELTDLVLAGTKTATASLEVEWDLDGDPLPVPGWREVVVDADGRYVAVVETTEVRVLRMADVDDEFARDEGEGFADAAEWRVAHERFWNAYLDSLREQMGDPEWSLTDDTRIVCERFRLVERFPEPIDPEAGA